MSMIELGNNTYNLNCSAATPLLYKQLYKEDFIRTNQRIRDLNQKQEKILKTLKAKNEGADENELKRIAVSDPDYMEVTIQLNEIVEPMVQQLAYIMYLEGTFKIDEIYQRLDMKKYIEFLLSVGPDEFKTKGKLILNLYNKNNNTSESNPKKD